MQRQRGPFVQRRIDVIVDRRRERGDGGGAEPGEDRDDLAFAGEAMLDQAADLGLRRGDQIAVSRRDGIDRIGEHTFERGDVGRHVARRRHDDHRRAAHHVIARHEHAIVFQQITHVIGDVTGRQQRTQREFSGHQAVVLRE